MNQPSARYVLSFQTEPFYQGTRYHWIICGSQNPDELVSWGHAPTQKLAETAAQNEVHALSSGLTKGGPMIDMSKPAIHRRYWDY